MPDKKNPAVMSPALERAILFLQSPMGDAPDQCEHLAAVHYLLNHANEAHPRLLELLQSNRASNPYAVIEILPGFGRRESIPVLEELMNRGPANLCLAAALALGAHPLDEAREALLCELGHAKKEIVIAAADGIALRRDPFACAALKKLFAHPDPDLRYHILQAAGSLGCLNHAALSAIARDDSSPDIRELANQFINAEPDTGARP